MVIEIRPFVEEDFPRITEMRQEAFRAPVRHGAWRRGGGRVLTENDRIIATTLVDALGQFFGGRSIPTAAISAVVTDPTRRGMGYGSRLLRQVLAEQRELGVPLAVLYPSLAGIYRRAGFEVAGGHVRYRLAVRSFPGHGDPSLLAHWDDADLPGVNAGYRAAGLASAGQLDRSPAWWQERLLYPADGPLYRFLVRDENGVAGHIVYTQVPVDGPEGYDYDLQVRDISWRTATAALALLAFVGANQPMGRDVVWTGPVDEPLLAFLSGVGPRADWHFSWMLRLLDVRAALEARGYPPDLTLSTAITIDDTVLPANSGSYRISVSAGEARVEPHSGPAPSCDIGAFSALYSGWSRAEALVRLGRLRDATPADLARLDLLFGGPTPWMTEII